MIYILHGEDTLASYTRLNNLVSKYSKSQIQRFSKEDTRERFFESLFAINFIDAKSVLICEDFIINKKVKPTNLKKIPQDISIFFWEKGRISAQAFKNTIPSVKIEEFKIAPILFYFLDSLGQAPKTSISLLKKIESKSNLLWQISFRLLILRLSKEGVSQQKTSMIIKRQIPEWQWQKILSQAKKVSNETLENLMLSILRIDFMKKQGKTTSDDETLLSLLLLKHFKDS